MKKLFEMPELLSLNGNPFTGEELYGADGQGCGGGCVNGCCSGCKVGLGEGKPPPI